MSIMKRYRRIASLLMLSGVCFLTACVSKRSEMGVQNFWRDSVAPTFEKGRATQAEVMQALGPPSQVIALADQTLFYYLREQSRTKAMFLIIYNRTRQQITYDRAIFFFDKKSVLTDFAYSKEVIQPEK